MLRILKDRYRPVFCSDSFYFANQKLFSEWNSLFKKLSSTEKVAAWVAGLSLLRRSGDWFGGLRKQDFSAETSVAHPLRLEDLLTPSSSLKIPSQLKSFDLFQVIRQVRIKALPETALRALAHMSTQQYPIEVIQFVPTPAELLQYQLEGRRILSFNEDFATWPTTLYHGRDFLSFMIHDLIHADHFFATSEHRAGQLGFYRCIAMILKREDLQEFLKNENFKEAFEYIISDMNSHPLHLFKTLHARLQHLLENEMKTKSLWSGWTSVWSSEDLTVFSALQKINTQLFSDTDALEITRWCIALGHNSRLA